jgi:hypothetical protein
MQSSDGLSAKPDGEEDDHVKGDSNVDSHFWSESADQNSVMISSVNPSDGLDR